MSDPLLAWTYCPVCGDAIGPNLGVWVSATDGRVRYCDARCFQERTPVGPVYEDLRGMRVLGWSNGYGGWTSVEEKP